MTYLFKSNIRISLITLSQGACLMYWRDDKSFSFSFILHPNYCCPLATQLMLYSIQFSEVFFCFWLQVTLMKSYEWLRSIPIYKPHTTISWCGSFRPIESIWFSLMYEFRPADLCMSDYAHHLSRICGRIGERSASIHLKGRNSNLGNGEIS